MRKLLLLLLGLGLIWVCDLGVAKTVKLYSAPNTRSSVVAQLRSGDAILPIYMPKNNSQWLKVANPLNGDVGWLPIAELNGSMELPNGAIFTQRFKRTISKNNIDEMVIHSMEYKQVGKDGYLQDERNLWQQMQDEESQLFDSVNGMMQNMRAGFSRLPTLDPDVLFRSRDGFEMAQPMIVIPEGNDNNDKKS